MNAYAAFPGVLTAERAKGGVFGCGEGDFQDAYGQPSQQVYFVCAVQGSCRSRLRFPLSRG